MEKLNYLRRGVALPYFLFLLLFWVLVSFPSFRPSAHAVALLQQDCNNVLMLRAIISTPTLSIVLLREFFAGVGC